MADMAPTEKAEGQLRRVIATAWMTNGESVWPPGAENPDVHAMADIAARAAWAYFLDILDASKAARGG